MALKYDFHNKVQRSRHTGVVGDVGGNRPETAMSLSGLRLWASFVATQYAFPAGSLPATSVAG